VESIPSGKHMGWHAGRILQKAAPRPTFCANDPADEGWGAPSLSRLWPI